MVDCEKGEIIHASDLIPNYTGTQIKKTLEDIFSIPCEVENDVNCAGLAEYFSGSAKGSSISLCLTIGTGIGGSIIINDKVFHGFSKKCGFKGYREFIFLYEQNFVEKPSNVTTNYTKKVLDTYQELLNKSYALLDEEQMVRITKLFNQKKRVYVYGRGSSALAAQEIKLRFMRIGVNIESIVDSHIMKMNFVLLNSDCLVIGISVSGKTDEVLDSLKAAKSRNATTVLITSRKEKEFEEFCDEIILLAVKEHLDNGKAISPQFPILVMVDIFYAHFLQSDKFHKQELHDYTLNALHNNKSM